MQAVLKQFGFTLLELLITLSIAGILTAVAAPSFTKLLSGGEISRVTNELAQSMRYARSEAIKSAIRTTVCISNNSSDASPDCSNSSDWSKGWIIYSDVNNDNARNDGELVILQHEKMKYGFSITSDTVYQKRVSFDGMGSSTTTTNLFSSGSIKVDYANESRTIHIKSSGRISIE